MKRWRDRFPQSWSSKRKSLLNKNSLLCLLCLLNSNQNYTQSIYSKRAQSTSG